MNDRQAAPGPDDEQEIDLASAWERVKARWWLPVGGLVLGAVVGIALALSGGSVFRAETIVYLGQPFAVLGGGQIQSLATNPRTVSEIVRSEAVLQDVSYETGIPVSKLRSSISTTELVATGQPRATVTPPYAGWPPSLRRPGPQCSAPGPAGSRQKRPVLRPRA